MAERVSRRRNKVTKDEALQVLAAAGYKVEELKQKDISKTLFPDRIFPDRKKESTQTKIIQERRSKQLKTKINPYGVTKKDHVPKPPTYVKVTLFAKHSIGSGGIQVTDKDGTHIINEGVTTYGPGVCMIPVSLAAQLVYADAKAREADEQMLSREPRYALIVPKIAADGSRHNVGVYVPEDVLDPGAMLTSLGNQYTYRIG